MKILITGGSGFIGSHVVEHYQDIAEVVVLDNLRSGHRKNLDGLKCRFVEGSIMDKPLLDEVMQGGGLHLPSRRPHQRAGIHATTRRNRRT